MRATNPSATLMSPSRGTMATFESFEHSGPRGRLLLNASLDASGFEGQGLAPQGPYKLRRREGGVDVYYAA